MKKTYNIIKIINAEFILCFQIVGDALTKMSDKLKYPHQQLAKIVKTKTPTTMLIMDLTTTFSW